SGGTAKEHCDVRQHDLGGGGCGAGGAAGRGAAKYAAERGGGCAYRAWEAARLGESRGGGAGAGGAGGADCADGEDGAGRDRDAGRLIGCRRADAARRTMWGERALATVGLLDDGRE